MTLALQTYSNERQRLDCLPRDDSKVVSEVPGECRCPGTVNMKRRFMEQGSVRRSFCPDVNALGPHRLPRFRDCQLDEIDPTLPGRIYRGGGKSVVSPETGSGPGHWFLGRKHGVLLYMRDPPCN
jgi:hypothetical protein